MDWPAFTPPEVRIHHRCAMLGMPKGPTFLAGRRAGARFRTAHLSSRVAADGHEERYAANCSVCDAEAGGTFGEGT